MIQLGFNSSIHVHVYTYFSSDLYFLSPDHQVVSGPVGFHPLGLPAHIHTVHYKTSTKQPVEFGMDKDHPQHIKQDGTTLRK